MPILRPSATLSRAASTRGRRPVRVARPALLLTLVLALSAPAVAPPSVQAAMSATQAEAHLLGWVNDARRARGLVPLRRMYDLAVIAGRRSVRMAETGTLSHTVAGSLSGQLADRHVTWYRHGETIGYSGASWTYDAARSLFEQWRGSASHWTLLMSDRFNYAGVGIAYRSSDRRTFGTIVLTESPDRTGGRAWFTGASRSGDDVRWTFAGADNRLQTHTAGFRDLDVQYRVGSGSWRTIRNDTTVTSIALSDRSRGTHSLRIRTTDRRGNVGAWTTPSTILVP